MLADSLGLTVNELVDIHTDLRYGPETLQFTSVEFETLLSKLVQRIEQSSANPHIDYWFLGTPWPDTPDLYNQARNLFERALQAYSHTQREFECEVAIILFLKLLAQDDSILKEARSFFSMLGRAIA